MMMGSFLIVEDLQIHGLFLLFLLLIVFGVSSANVSLEHHYHAQN